MKEANFELHNWVNGFVAECDRQYPSMLYSVQDGHLQEHQRRGAWFGYVHGAFASLSIRGRSYDLARGDYFSVAEPFLISGKEVLLILREGADVPFMIGHDRNQKGGRLKYIDGCTDSLLISPWKMGQPCLNLLYFPEGIDQTTHTHPSDRLGVITAGKGRCVTPNGQYDLLPGMIWRIPAGGIHKFQTDPGESMTVIAYHPDSDFGPRDEHHPMLNRTVIDGVSAADPSRAQFRTQ